MLLSHLCTTNLIATQAAIHNQFSCEVSFRTFEGTPCTGIFQRLFLSPFQCQFLHGSQNIISVSLCQLQGDRQQNIFGMLDSTGPITKGHILTGYRHQIPFRTHQHGGLDYLLHFTAIGSRVHYHSTPNGSGNTGSEFQPGQPLFSSHSCYRGQQHACTYRNQIVSDQYIRKFS